MTKRTLRVNTHEAKSNLSALLRAVEEGAVVRICRNDKPIAELRCISAAETDPLALHPELSKVVFNEDPSLPGANEDWPESSR